MILIKYYEITNSFFRTLLIKMAVYTKITQQDINYLFQDYDGIEQIKGIAEGVENTNYLVNTKNQNKFIFTIFEKRTKRSDLPFFS